VKEPPPVEHDNRIPAALRARQIALAAGNDALRYDDWIAEQPSANGRIVVAAADRRNSDDSPFTLSLIVPNDPELRAQMLSSHEWDLDQDEMMRVAVARGFGDELRPDQFDGVPLTLNRTHLDRPSELDIAQVLVLSFGAFRRDNELRFVDLDGNEHTLAWFSNKSDVERIEMSERYLREFLRDRNAILVRFHDHRRSDRARAGAEQRQELSENNPTRNYAIVVQIDGDRGMGLLCGKDIIEPYSPSAAGALTRDEGPTFVIGVDAEGEEIAAPVDPDVLSNYFTDRGTPHFLTDVYFRPEVLDKYYDAAGDFKVDEGSIQRNGIWSIPYALTQDGLVHVQLGDLSRIAVAERYHWRAYNIVAHGGIPEDRFRRDFLAEWTPSTDPVAKLKSTLGALQERSIALYSEPVILPLREGDQHHLSSLRVPPNDEWRGFDGQLLNIAKPVMDSINVALLRRLVLWNGDGKDERPPIVLFEQWLVSLGVPSADAAAPASAFRTAQSFRSSSGAHRKSADLNKTIRKLGFNRPRNFATKPLKNQGLRRSSAPFSSVLVSLLDSPSSFFRILRITIPSSRGGLHDVADANDVIRGHRKREDS